MKCAAAISVEARSSVAADAVAERVRGELGGAPADLALVFASMHHAEEADQIVDRVNRRLGPRCLLGCTAEAIVGVDQEVERQPAVSLWAAHLGEADLQPFHLQFEQTREGASFVGWPDAMPGELARGSAMVLLADPFTFPADELLERVNEDHPGTPVVGGNASGAMGPGHAKLFLGGQVLQQGAVGAVLSGPIAVHTIVSQGCRPIGVPLVVTRSEENVIFELGGRPALEQLEELFGRLNGEDQALVRQGLHVGRVINEYKEQFRRGDFLVRNVMGADPESGAIAVGELVRPGQTIQFHVRDARTASEDLHEMLQQATSELSSSHIAGALLFTCNGRGRRLFGEASHDVGAVRRRLGPLPVAGFFAAGEIGPVGGRNFLHGFTASVAVFGLPREHAPIQ